MDINLINFLEELETLFNEAVESSKNEFLEIGFLYGKEKK